MFIRILFAPHKQVISEDDADGSAEHNKAPHGGGDVSAKQKAANIDEENAKKRLVAQKMRNQFDVVIDQASEHKMADILTKTPLATVKAGPQSGNFLCHLDCNHYGEATSAPSIRKVPMGKDAFKKL